VNEGQGSSSWHTNLFFRPAYYNGESYYGTYNWKLERTPDAWINNGDFHHDQAFISFFPRNGVELADAVGSNGLMVNVGPNHSPVRIWGYPAQSPFTGEVSYYCDGDSSRRFIGDYGTFDAEMPCPMNGGASGGPWLIDRLDADLGYIFAVTSRCAADANGRCLYSSESRLYATPHDGEVLDMFNAM